jgi:hypothetical protein
MTAEPTTRPTYRKGDRITVTGYGRTARWGNIAGTVTRATKRSVFVHWDGCHFTEDEMDYAEVKPLI